jgi:formylglycine-generating enzyme required for sulfatase activity
MKAKYHMRFLLCVICFVSVGCNTGKSQDQRRPETQNNDSHEKASPTHIAGKDGAAMALIPTGVFQMGSDNGAPDEQPVHTVYLDAFYIDKYEVTVGEYKQFVKATGHPAPDWDRVVEYASTDGHPIVYVSWYDAMAYAKWAGKTLPTEAQWEYAARGGLEGKAYPWGDEACDKTKANYDSSEIGKTTPVGKYSPNGYGLYDMAGNVWEWCMDEYDVGFYAKSPANNPVSGGFISFVDDVFTKVTTRRVVRGGGWDAPSRRVRVVHRDGNGPIGAVDSIGFRCIAPVAP